MSIIAKALQKAQKERAEKLRREEEALKKVRAEAAARLATQKAQEAPPPAKEAEPQTSAPLPAEKKAPAKKSLFPYILGGGIILLCVAVIGVVLYVRPFLEISQNKVKKTEPAAPVYRPVTPPKKTVQTAPEKPAEPAAVKPVTAQKPKPVPVTVNPSDLPVVSGIMYSAANPRAIVNGALVSEGDMVTGYTIRKINPSTVIVSSQGSDYEIRLR
jgi:hypothetical protein